MASKKIDLCVPADRNMMLVIRMTTVGVMSRAGLTMDETDDMKMAIDEACNLMLLQKAGCESVAVEFEMDEREVQVLIKSQGSLAEEKEKVDLNMQEVIRCILESMVDEVEIETAESGITQSVCLKKRLADCRRSAV